MFDSRIACGAFVALSLAWLPLAGCGSSASKSGKSAQASAPVASNAARTVGASSPSSGAVVATVGATQISEGALRHRMSILAREGHLTPPDPSGHAAEALRRKALTYLISSAWLIEGAREVNRGVSNQQAEAKVREAANRLFRSAAEYQRSLTSTGRTPADALLELQTSQSSENLRAYVVEKARRVTPADVLARFKQDPGRYATPETRDLDIVRVNTEAEALKARAEIIAGRSFASVAKGKPDQPAYAHDGFIAGLPSTGHAKSKLAGAIFAAKPNTLSQPVGIALGFFLFEVKRTHPAQRRTLAEVRQRILQELTKRAQQTTLDRFVSGWRATWKSRTHCRPGFVVSNCSESRDAPTRAAEGPYALA